jgi:hypothetical protein
MKQTIKVLVIIIMTSLAVAGTVTVPNGSVIPVKTTNQLSSAQLMLGQEVICSVAQDVKIDGQVVIKAGSPVYGSVQESKGGQMAGIAGSIIIALNSVVAVDGTNIAITGSFSNAAKSEVGGTVAVGVILCPLALLNTGDDGVIPVGMQVRAMTMGTFDILVE